MTKFLDKSFSTYAPGDRRYADNWERTFGKMKPAPVPAGGLRPASAPTVEGLMVPMTHEEATKALSKWVDSLACTAPEAYRNRLLNHASALVSLVNGARVKGYLAGVASQRDSASAPETCTKCRERQDEYEVFLDEVDDMRKRAETAEAQLAGLNKGAAVDVDPGCECEEASEGWHKLDCPRAVQDDVDPCVLGTEGGKSCDQSSSSSSAPLPSSLPSAGGYGGVPTGTSETDNACADCGTTNPYGEGHPVWCDAMRGNQEHQPELRPAGHSSGVDSKGGE